MERRAERRLITALFIDVVGSTDLTVRLGPERMKRTLDEAFPHIRDLIVGQGGTIEKYVGDAIFALFGAPVAHTDDPERALRAAEACIRWAAEREAHHDVALAVRVGVETGEAIVDLEAASGEVQQMTVGTPINLAARLQQAADPGQVLVGPGCHEATADVAEFESLGLRGFKGLGEVQTWRLIRLTGIRAAPAVPFFGRRQELERLRSSFARARTGRAALAVVIGPPGQGKTRLAEELIRDLRGQARLLQARCRPGGEIGSLTPLKQILASDVADPTTELVGARVDVLLNDPSERRRRVTAALCHSAGLLVDERLLGLRPFEREQELAYAWRRYFDGLGREQTVLLWIEDIHWAEPQLVRLMDRVTFGEDLPLLVLATGRPEFGASAVLRPGEGRLILELGRLDLDASLALGRAVGATDDQAIRRAEGHPLFIIELARSRPPVGHELPINVQAAIAARLDELPSTERELLQCAAVAGETFTVHDAALLGSRDHAEVAGILGRLAHLRYLLPLEQGFRFHHVLVHDVAYGRLPAAERMRLHARHAWEGVDPDDAEALAHHWWEALRPPDADWVWEGAAEREEMRQEGLKAHLAAGRRLSDRLERERAVEVLERVLALAHGPSEVASVEEAIAFAHTRDGRGDEAWEHHLRAIAAYREAGAAPPASLYADMLETPVHRWGFFRVLPPEDLVLRLLLEGQQIARTTQDIPSLARLLAHHAFFHLKHEFAGEAVRLAETWQDPPQLADVLQRAAALFLQTGEIDRAAASYKHIDHLVAAGGQIEELDALMWRAILGFAAGDLVRAGEFADRLLERSATSNAHWRTHALGTKGLVLLGPGRMVGGRGDRCHHRRHSHEPSGRRLLSHRRRCDRLRRGRGCPRGAAIA